MFSVYNNIVFSVYVIFKVVGVIKSIMCKNAGFF